MNKMLIVNDLYVNVKYNGRDRVLESKTLDRKEAALLMDEVARRWNFFEEHDRDDVKRKLEMLSKVYMVVHQYAGTVDFTDKIREAITVPPPPTTVGDLEPGDVAMFIRANDFWEGIEFSIDKRKNTADRNNVSIYPLNGKCTAIHIAKSTPCERVKEKK